MNGQSHSSNSWIGSSSTAVTPSACRYGIFSIRPAKVPGWATQRRRMAGEAADVQLVDDGVFERRQRRRILLPVEGPAQEDAAARWWLRRSGLAATGPRRRRRTGRWRRDRAGRGRDRSSGPAARAVDAPAVAERRRQAGDQDVPVVAGAVAARVQGDLGQRLAAVQRVEDQEHRGAVAAQQGEVDAVGLGRGAQRQGNGRGRSAG